jgi:hypothetical protein
VINKGSLKRLAILLLVAAGVLAWAYFSMIRMPGRSYRGTLPDLTEAQAALADELRRDVEMLAGTIGPRSILHLAGLRQGEAFLEQSLRDAGYQVKRQEFKVGGVTCANLEVEIRGSQRPQEIVVIGAHYDSVDDCPAANDNGSGVAATLALARRFAPPTSPSTSTSTSATPSARTLRFVLFVNEEPPYFQTADMGSLVYARFCQQRGDNIVAMMSLETIGFYSDRPGSQHYPVKPIAWLYPDQGNFLAFVGNYNSRSLVRQAIGSFRHAAPFPSEGAALPGWIEGVGWSDHWAFWQCGYPAIMLTDTAPFRYPHYHGRGDTSDKLDYPGMARVVAGIEAVTADLAR